MLVRIESYTKNSPTKYNKVVQVLEYNERRILMANSTNSLAHKMVTQVPCSDRLKIPKGNNIQTIRKNLRDIIRTLRKYKGVEIIEGHIMSDHVYLFDQYTVKNKYIKFYGVFKGEKCIDDV